MYVLEIYEFHRYIIFMYVFEIYEFPRYINFVYVRAYVFVPMYLPVSPRVAVTQLSVFNCRLESNICA